jgi:exopolysaccharide biosynthesis polyprenyl glycosylphosphotransferase
VTPEVSTPSETVETNIKPITVTKSAVLPVPPVRRRTNRTLISFFFFLCQIGLDTVAIGAGFWVAYMIRQKLPFGGVFIPFSPDTYRIVLPLSIVAVLFAFYQRSLYKVKRGFSFIDEFYRICAATFFGLIFAIALNSVLLGANFQYSRIILVYALVLIIVFSTVLRFTFNGLISALRKRGAAQIRLVVVGTGDTARRIIRRVTASPELGYNIVGVIVDEHADPDPQENNILNVPILGNLRDLRETVTKYGITEIIVTVSGASQSHLLDLVALCEDLPIDVKIYPDAFQLITTNEVSIGSLTGLPLVSVKAASLRGVNRVIKRVMDIVLSGIILIITSPLMFFTAILIKLTDPKGPVFYTQERVGLDGNNFTVIKFRSMKVDSEKNGPGWTTKNDPRRTRFGSFIRRYSIDELPQFINVLIGEMSIVGPRPEQPQFVEQFKQTIPHYMRRHREKAGITGWAQVNGLRGDTSIAERTRYDLYYVENWSVLLDLKIILKSIIVVFTDKNAY